MVRLEAQRLLIAGRRFGPFALLAEDRSQVVMSFGIGRLEA
jgi:hypothetical protein